MAEIASLARPYAEALYQSGSGDLNGVLAWLETMSAAAESPELLQFAGNPKATDDQVYGLVAAVFDQRQQPMTAHAQNFLKVVVENGRLSALPEVLAQFRMLKNAQSGLADAVVYSAFPIEGDALAGVASWLEKRFNRRLNVSVALDASLIGGIRAVVGDEVLDASVKSRLDQMKTALTA
ncbi:MAG: F0F1 ATP synthase subunit delta [Burkholderiales bacterium]|nr:F0F1 ATP synthase subunit delta [Burkholderiales bacterium]